MRFIFRCALLFGLLYVLFPNQIRSMLAEMNGTSVSAIGGNHSNGEQERHDDVRRPPLPVGTSPIETAFSFCQDNSSFCISAMGVIQPILDRLAEGTRLAQHLIDSRALSDDKSADGRSGATEPVSNN